MPITAQDNPPGLSIYAYTPGRGYSWAKIIAGRTVPISLAAGRHDDNDERRRLFKRSAPSYVEGGRIVEIFSYADQRPRASPEAYAFAGFAKMSIHRWSRHQARLSYVEALAR